MTAKTETHSSGARHQNPWFKLYILLATSLINIVQHNYNRSAILMEVG